MKINYLILLLTALSLMATAQSNSRDKRFLKSVFPESEKVVYSESIVNKGLSEHIKTILNKDTIRNYNYDPDPGNYLVLSMSDRNEITQQLDMMATFRWKKKVFNNSHRLSVSEAQALLTQRMLGPWETFQREYGQNLYQFAKPVFFRGNTFCLFYYDSRCGILCGKGLIAIYRLTNGNWEKWLTLEEWLS